MLFWQAIILGIVEGVTEFLPISSTFHLLFATKFLGVPESEFSKFFAVFIQAGAMVPVVLLFWQDWFANRKLLWKLGWSFVPTAIIGLLLHKVVKGVFFEQEALMMLAFACVGVLFIVAEEVLRRRKLSLSRSLGGLTIFDAVVIGTVQATAVLPGVSRAGAVILGMLLLGYRRDEAGKYSFMLAVPTIVAAAGLDFWQARHMVGVLSTENLWLLTVGFGTAALSSFFVVRWFIGFLRQHTLSSFGLYRVIASGLLFAAGFGR